MNYSDNPEQFNKELLDALYSALKDIATAGGVKKIKKGDFYAEYRSMAEIRKDIKEIEDTLFYEKYPCTRRVC